MKIAIYPFLLLIFAIPVQSQTFKTVPTTGSQKIQLDLKSLKAAVPGIEYQVYQDSLDLNPYQSRWNPLNPTDYFRHRVILLNVDRTRCLQLKNHFADASLVNCEFLKNNPQEIDLRAFLEPAIQAVEGKIYLNQEVVLSPGIKMEDGFVVSTVPTLEEHDSRGGLLVRNYSEETNCWGTSWEIARRSNKDFSVQVGSGDLNKFLQDKRNVTDVVATTKDIAKYLREIKYRDILIVSDKKSGQVLHVATFIDQNLLFEKQGNATQYPFRFSKLEQITGLYSKKGVVYRVVRAKANFPAAETVEKKWTHEFGPKDEDYEGQSGVTYHQPVRFSLVAQDSKYVLSNRDNAYSEDTVAKLEVAQTESDALAALNADPFVVGRLPQDEISALAKDIITPKYPDLSKKATLLKALYVR
ncbi:MAG: hypothetical protein J7501_16770 [Bdellovibrio sp.]|nr:hypothetical protein [Bdellovibrio sp.]